MKFWYFIPGEKMGKSTASRALAASVFTRRSWDRNDTERLNGNESGTHLQHHKQEPSTIQDSCRIYNNWLYRALLSSFTPYPKVHRAEVSNIRLPYIAINK